MSYQQHGNIQASDFNTIVGSNSTTPGTINYIWSTGYSTIGYGQPALTTVNQRSIVTASNWATMLSALNNSLGHQGQTQVSGTNYTTGQNITYFSNITTAVTTINTNYASYYAQGASYNSYPTWTNNTVIALAGQSFGPTGIIASQVKFATGDAARYFFNCGGQIKFVSLEGTNNDGTTRSDDILSLLVGLGTYTMSKAEYFASPSGASYATAVNNISGTSPYTADYVNLKYQTNGGQASNGDNGSIITFVTNVYSAAHSAFNGSLNVSWSYYFTIIPPETTRLTNSWGTITFVQ
jgi:hypothetical protein